MTTKAMTKTKMPKNVNTKALTTFARGTILISFASCVVMVAAVDGPIGTGIVPDRLGNILQLMHGVHAPATVLSEANRSKNQDTIKKIEFTKHQSLSLLKIGAGG
jgi:hypothetical protein